MEAFALYLFKSIVWLTGFALVYLLFLRNERYFLLNRVYLVSGILASIIFPFFTWHYTIVIPFVPNVEVSDLQMTGVINEPEPFSTKEALLILYLAGAIYLLYRIVRQTIKVIGVIRQSEILPYRSAKLIHTADYPSSFSFFSFVFVNPSSSDTETNEIVNHEIEHVRQCHWIDLMLFELLCILQWLNPLCWLYGRFIRQNHEYLADQHALQRTANPAIYRAALINQLFGGEVITLANSFNYSINKKRFHMMKNTIHPPVRKLKLLVILPLIAAVFYAFATPEYKYTQENVNVTQRTEKTITGKVMDEKGNPLKGAALIISGTTIGTVTDDNGAFKLILTDVIPLLVSHVGYESQKLTPDTEKEMIITMKPANIAIDQVTVTSPEINSGQSSLGSTIKLQTNSPLKFGNVEGSAPQPLIVIDGVITENANAKNIINNIPPATLESVSIFKGEEATKLYGDKGKNGVIVITRKKDASGGQNNLIDVKINQSANTQKEDKVYNMVEVMPEFPGGDAALRKFIVENVRYPFAAMKENIQGKVFVSFVVDNTGKVTDAKIVRGVAPSLDDEALRVVNSMPLWKPGKQGGQDVNVQYTMPINFVLEENKTEVKEGQDNRPYMIVEQMPEFPGGLEALKTFILANVQYPSAAKEKGIQGKVYVSFVVTKTGIVTDAKVVRGVELSLDKEAIRVIQLMPAWIPGRQKGEAVDVAYTVPINFMLEKEKSDGKLESTDNKNDSPFIHVEQTPEFPGGEVALRNFIASNVKYPDEAKQKGIQGKVYISFMITKTGSVTKAKVARGVDPSLDEEALRVIQLMPAWIPAKINSEVVDIAYTIPVEFKLKNSDKTEASQQNAPQMGKLLIVPNPTSSSATVTLEGSDSTNKLQVSIIDSFGKLQKKETPNGPSFQISVATLAPGTYVVVAIDGNKQYQGSLVVNH